MSNTINNLVLRTVISPYNDITKSSVLSQSDVDNNFIYLKGFVISSTTFNGNILSLNYIDGDKISVNLSGITATGNFLPISGGTLTGGLFGTTSRFGGSSYMNVDNYGTLSFISGSSGGWYSVPSNTFAFKHQGTTAGLYYNANSIGYEFFDYVQSIPTSKISGRYTGSDFQKITYFNANGGYLGIGTSSPVFMLDVSGQTRMTKLNLTTGGTGSVGVITLTAGTGTVLNSLVTDNSIIILTHQNISGTLGILYISNKTSGYSFNITSTNSLDTSIVGYQIIN
jgi:hypothetical protein